MEGGGQLPYWFEESVLAFLRQGDLLRLKKENLLSESSLRNPFGTEILRQFEEAGRAKDAVRSWLGLSWRQYLYWFFDVESRISKGSSTSESLLRTADANWQKLDKAKILMEERPNDGTWIRIWLNALREFRDDDSSTTRG